MHYGPALRRAALGLVLLILLAQAWMSLSGGIQRIPDATTAGRQAQTVTELLCGVLSLGGVVSTLWRRRWLRWVQWCWAGSVALVAGPSSVVWGRATPLRGLLISAAALLAALGVLWLWRAGTPGLARGHDGHAERRPG